MKLITNELGRILVAVAAVVFVLPLIALLVIPGIRGFVSTTFPQETNFVINDQSTSSFTLTCDEDVYEWLIDSEGKDVPVEDIFADITARASDGTDLVPLLKADYEKPVKELRDHVFIYRVNKDGSTTLSDKIDTSKYGEWAVIYVLKDGDNRAALKVTYVFM